MDYSVKDIDTKLKGFNNKLILMRTSLSINDKRIELKEVSEDLNNPDVWKDNERMANLNKKKRMLENSLEVFDELEQKIDDLKVLFDIAIEEDHIDEEVSTTIDDVEKTLQKLEFQKMLGGKMDGNNAIMSINAAFMHHLSTQSREFWITVCFSWIKHSMKVRRLKRLIASTPTEPHIAIYFMMAQIGDGALALQRKSGMPKSHLNKMGNPLRIRI